MTLMARTTRKPVPPSRRIAVLRALGLGLSASTTIGLGVALAGPAAADARREPFALQCDVLGPITISVPAQAPYTPGLEVGSTRIGVPYAFTSTLTFTPTGGEPQTSVDQYSKPAPAHARHDRCIFHEEGSDESGTFILDGEVMVSYTPH